jgi:hypothetical protein
MEKMQKIDVPVKITYSLIIALSFLLENVIRNDGVKKNLFFSNLYPKVKSPCSTLK